MPTEFEYKKNVKIVVDFEVGEKILIKDWGYQLDGEHTILEFKKSFGSSQSGVLVKITGYDRWLDVGWLDKIIAN